MRESACRYCTCLFSRIFSSDVHDVIVAVSWSLELQRHCGCSVGIGNSLSNCRRLAVRRVWMAIHVDFYNCHILLSSGKQATFVIYVEYTSIVANFHCNVDYSTTPLNCCTKNIWATRCGVRALCNFGSVLRE